jgi:protocatechuate 3,4-dioxygenase alpha subunit
MALRQTPSQTIGPFFAYGLTAMDSQYPGAQVANGSVVDAQTPEGPIRIIGRILDGAGAIVPDALVEIWQADSEGRHVGSAPGNTGFRGFGRQNTGIDPQGRFVFETVKPGSVDGKQAPHATFTIFMRGLLSHLYTRLYFPDEEAANARDPVLAQVPAARRPTLIARATGDRAYLFDIHLQGKNETVFFDV